MKSQLTSKGKWSMLHVSKAGKKGTVKKALFVLNLTSISHLCCILSSLKDTCKFGKNLLVFPDLV